MSKYLLSAGVVWVFLCFVVGVIILMMPTSKPEVSPSVYHRRPFEDQIDNSGPRSVTSNVAKTSVQVEGTPATPNNAAAATVQVKN